MTHPKLSKLDRQGFAYARIYPAIPSSAKVIDLVSKLNRAVAFFMGHIAFGKLDNLKGFRVAPDPKVGGVLVAINLRPTFQVRAIPEVEIISVGIRQKVGGDDHRVFSSSVGDVGAGAVCRHGVNHRAAIAAFGGICFRSVKAGKIFASALRAATANSGKAGCIGQAIRFVGGELAGHFVTLFASASCLASVLKSGRAKKAKTL